MRIILLFYEEFYKILFVRQITIIIEFIQELSLATIQLILINFPLNNNSNTKNKYYLIFLFKEY